MHEIIYADIPKNARKKHGGEDNQKHPFMSLHFGYLVT